MSRLIVFLSFMFVTIPISLAAERDLYSFSWLDPDKEVYVLQNRRYRKKNKFYFNVGAGVTTSGAFVDSSLYQGRTGYFFREEFGFEVIYAMSDGKENETAASLRNEGAAGSRPFRRIVDNYFGGMFTWAPFYTKTNTFDTIIYIDWILGAGVAKIQETSNEQEFLLGIDSTEMRTQDHTGLIWNIGALFYINETFGVRTDLTTTHYKAEKPSNISTEKVWYSNWDLALSLSARF